MEQSYHDEVNNKNVLKLRELLTTLPPFCKDFFRGIHDTTSSRTRIAYAYDLHVFFDFLHETNHIYRKMNIVDFHLSILIKKKSKNII